VSSHANHTNDTRKAMAMSQKIAETTPIKSAVANSQRGDGFSVMLRWVSQPSSYTGDVSLRL
jgi:hypothetical protein